MTYERERESHQQDGDSTTRLLGLNSLPVTPTSVNLPRVSPPGVQSTPVASPADAVILPLGAGGALLPAGRDESARVYPVSELRQRGAPLVGLRDQDLLVHLRSLLLSLLQTGMLS